MNELTGALPSHLTDRGEVADKTTMGKDDFMKLMMAQLQNQDPLNPMDHKEFGAQLAQFASLEKLTQIGDGIHKLEGGMGEEQKMQALGMIGKQVKASSAEVSLIENQPTDIHVNPENGFTPLKVSVYAGDGKFVREIDVDPKGGGKMVTWDGKDKDGAKLPTGKYMFRVAGTGPDGKAKESSAHLSGRVIGVEMVNNSPMLLIDAPNGQQKIELSKIQNIGSEDDKKAADGKMPAAGAKPAPAPTENKPVAANSNSADQEWAPRSGYYDPGQRWMEGKP